MSESKLRSLRNLAERRRRVLPSTGQPSAPPAAQTRPPEPLVHEPPLLCWPLDHFYSPVPDNRALMREPAHSRVFPPVPAPTPGIEWRDDDQVALLRDHLSRHRLDFPDGTTDDARDYHIDNGMFSRLDAWMLQAMLRHFGPGRVIEAGCGWSSLVTARVNREFFDARVRFTCIEPYPPDFLGEGIEGISELVVSPVQVVPVERFLELGAGDVLFIDTSHVAKTGGDVVFLYQEVLPRVAPGVVVHIHDIFLPWDYPEEWVRTGRAWNEQYILRAFLTFNSAFEILLGVPYMRRYHPEVLAAAIDGYPEKFLPGGGSMWLRRR